MQLFSQLITRLDQSNKTNDKIEALRWYFEKAPDADRLWALYFLSGRLPRRQISAAVLRTWSSEKSKLPLWLIEESYHSVGDLAETMALILPPPQKTLKKTLSQWMPEILELKNKNENEKKDFLFHAWDHLTKEERFVFNKLITGGFRIGVSQKLVIKGLAKVTALDEAVLAHRLMGDWDPTNITLDELISATETERSASQPYPFYLAYQLDIPFNELGKPEEFSAEWKWDGIRGQLIVRKGELYLWSRGEDLMTDRFPEFHEIVGQIPDGTVLDGEILGWSNNKPLPFGDLQTRIGRKTINKQLLENTPVFFMAYDVLEWEGKDIREKPFHERRAILDSTIWPLQIITSQQIQFDNWDELVNLREGARENGTEGIFLKRQSSPYQVGRKRGDWWKWKVDPLSVDAVLIYAQKGHGKRSDLYTDYTFAVWDGPDRKEDRKLITFAKAYSGLTNEELTKIDAFIKKNTKEKFGPVRTVKPALVFEIAFEGIQKSNRHKSGIAVRFPRILRWRHDKKIEDANTLDDLKALLTTT